MKELAGRWLARSYNNETVSAFTTEQIAGEILQRFAGYAVFS